MGQANHFLITIMVGLDAVDDGAQKRESFSTKWNPINITASVARSKHYAIKSALAWAVDNLDMYLRLCNREPRLYCKEESLEIAKTKHSIYSKFRCVINNHPELSVEKYAYVDLLICWRNNSVHFDAENELLPISQEYFRHINSDDVLINKYNLDVAQMLERFKNSACPSFKEAATLISMTLHFAEDLDRILLQNVNQYEYLATTLYHLLKNKGQSKERGSTGSTISTFDFRNTTLEKRVKRLKQLFATEGITEDFFNEDGKRFLAEAASLRENEFLCKMDEKRQSTIEA